MDVSRWLADQGLGRHAEAFAENGIGADVLGDLTDADLKELGLNLGDRKRLLKAIGVLSAGFARDRAEAAAPNATPAVPREAERRQLTVMFVDLVGSTHLSAQLDPEDMSAVIRTYHHAVVGEVARFEGHVAKYMGDGVLAYFGWPQAHEDDAERAVRAGLALVRAVGGLAAAGRPLAGRVGIATGLVMVGELIGEGVAKEQTVVGETPNLAARLQALAEPGSVIISQATRRLIGGLFELTDLGSLRVKGFAEPLAAFRVESEGRADGRFEAMHGQRLTPLIGREHELSMLLERWNRAKDGDGQVLLVKGDAGIGKSRLLRAMREELGSEPHVALRHFCSPYYINSPLHPIIMQLERAAGFASDDQAEDRLAKLEALLGRGTAQLDEAVPLIGALLGVPSDARYPAPDLSPQRQKQRTLEILIEQLAGLARSRPVLELYEDVHWVDPSTLELLDLLVERVRALPVLVVLTYRPEFQAPWTGHAHVNVLPLNRLGRRQGAAIALEVTGKALPSEIVEQIVARTDGVPLFVEELTKTVLESGLLADAGDHYELVGPLTSLAIPTTLHDSLMARLDRLAPVKEVAQIGAVIGREFSHELLAAVVSMPANELGDALEQLVQSELVFRRGTGREATYSFKHMLVQDAAYQSLLRSKRQRLHAAIVAVLESRVGERIEVTPELLAHHCTEAALTEKAIRYWSAAGERASRHSASAEAVGHFRRAQALLETLEDGPAVREQQLKLMVSLGPALITNQGPGTPDVHRAYSRALELCAGLPESPLHFAAHWGWWRISVDLRQGRQRANDLLSLAERMNDPELLLQAHHCQWATLFNLGDHATCCAHIEAGLALYDRERHGGHASLYGGHDPKVCGLGERALALWLLGYPEQALRSAESGLAHARDLTHAGSLAHSMDLMVMLHCYRRNAPAVLRWAGRMIDFSVEQALHDHKAKGEFFCGWARALSGEPVEGARAMEMALEAQRAIGTTEDFPVYYDMHAEVLALVDRIDEACSAIEHAFDAAESSGLVYWNAELHRRRAELLWRRARHPVEEARANLAAAFELARAQNARSLELRAAMTDLRMAEGNTKMRAARTALRSVYDCFSEGFETGDLKEAKSLLDELA